MTTDELMMMIDKKVEDNFQKELAAKKKREDETKELKQKIHDLQPRIAKVILLGNYAEGNGIKLNNSGGCCREGYDTGYFYTNSWSHLVGFVKDESGEIVKMGIAKGGACGDINFYTDGTDIYGYDTRTKTEVEPLFYDMKRFVEAFDDFETALFEYIEKRCKL